MTGCILVMISEAQLETFIFSQIISPSFLCDGSAVLFSGSLVLCVTCELFRNTNI